jgi:hypothetical protein
MSLSSNNKVLQHLVDLERYPLNKLHSASSLYDVNFDYHPTWGSTRDRIAIAPFSKLLSEVESTFQATVKLDNASIRGNGNFYSTKYIIVCLNS